MKRPFRALTLPALALCSLLGSGCGSSTTNEEGVVQTKAAPDPNAKVFKTYGEKVLYDTEQAAKKKAEAKGAPKGQPETPKGAAETPK